MGHALPLDVLTSRRHVATFKAWVTLKYWGDNVARDVFWGMQLWQVARPYFVGVYPAAAGLGSALEALAAGVL